MKTRVTNPVPHFFIGRGFMSKTARALDKSDRSRDGRGKVPREFASAASASRVDPRRPARKRDPQAQPSHLGFQFYSVWPIFVLCAVWLVLNCFINAPKGIWFLAYGSMVPWLMVVGGTAKARRVYFVSWLLGSVYHLIEIRWIGHSTEPGYIVLSLYLGLYYAFAAWPLRHAVRRRRLPLAIAFPVVWVGVEYLRSLGYIAFPWLFLSHSQHSVLPMIQISDLVGAYGVSFVLAAFNGAIADAIFAYWGERGTRTRIGQVRRARVGVATAGVLLGATLAYGWHRLGENTLSAGPRVAVLQHDYPNYTDAELAQDQPGHREKASAYFDMMKQAEQAGQPDIFLLPETAWSYLYLNREFLEAKPEDLLNGYFRFARTESMRYYNALANFAADTGASVIIGSASLTPTPFSLWSEELLYNSAYHFRAEGGEPERHDKIHPVLFGEMVPFRYGRLRFLYLWFNSLSPFGVGGFEYSLSPGEDLNAFTMTAESDGRKYRFGTPICYEDVMPYVARGFVRGEGEDGKRVDFLLNISNDGWFLHSDELPQHFAICVFRAVENRVGIARSVNTGVSGFIDPNGRAYSKIGVGETGFRVDHVMIDTRYSFYSRTGDVFALTCAVLWWLLCLDYICVRARWGDEEEDSA